MTLTPEKLDYVEPVNDNLICLVCQIPFQQPKLLFCGHVFCNHCITSWLTIYHYNECPMCRQTVILFPAYFNNKLLIYIYRLLYLKSENQVGLLNI